MPSITSVYVSLGIWYISISHLLLASLRLEKSSKESLELKLACSSICFRDKQLYTDSNGEESAEMHPETYRAPHKVFHRRFMQGLTLVQGVLVLVLIAVAAMVGVIYLQSLSSSASRVVVSTTTSLYDTGLLEVVGTKFEQEQKIDISFISAGTGLAIQYAQRGDSDVILVHSPSQELTFLQGGDGVNRKIIAYNFFMIVGPSHDSAEVRGLSPLEALKKIKQAGEAGIALWASRGDDSGTHTKEKSLWKAAAIDVEKIREESWYVEAGAGMGKTLQLANEKQAYTLSDAGTYLKYAKDGLISLEALVTQGRELLNVYSVIAVNPSKHPDANFEGTMRFIEFLVSQEGQDLIESYGQEDYGQPLFYPAVRLLQENTNPELLSWIQSYAYFDGSECPPQYRHQEGALYEEE